MFMRNLAPARMGRAKRNPSLPYRSGLLLCFLSGTLMATSLEGPQLGQPATTEEIAAQDHHIFPDGTGLPPGKGSAVEGKELYDSRCAACHGPKGMGGSAEELAGGGRLIGPHPDKNIGTYWPYATTLFDFIRRSMPLDAPRSLSDDQIYAISAYLLYLNGIIEERTEMNRQTLARIDMPNRNGFIKMWPE
jgi:cytochrome c